MIGVSRTREGAEAVEQAAGDAVGAADPGDVLADQEDASSRSISSTRAWLMPCQNFIERVSDGGGAHAAIASA